MGNAEKPPGSLTELANKYIQIGLRGENRKLLEKEIERLKKTFSLIAKVTDKKDCRAKY